MISLIAAMTKNRVIGVDNKMPWHISEEFKNFKEWTSGNTVVMGRKTFESIGRPLPNRNNIVISRSMNETAGVDVCSSIEEALDKAKEYGKEIFIIGGSSIYEQTISLADRLVISFVKLETEGDSLFPEIGPEWKEESRKDFSEFELVVYKKN